jgi:hypothetical protein
MEKHYKYLLLISACGIAGAIAGVIIGSLFLK